MKKPIAIIAGEPNSISSEIIFKTWKSKSRYQHKPFFIIGSIKLLNSQMKKLKYNIKINKIYNNFRLKDLPKNELSVYDIKYNQKKPFENLSTRSNVYILKCFDVAIKLSKKNRLVGLVNCPVSKESLFKNNNAVQGMENQNLIPV